MAATFTFTQSDQRPYFAVVLKNSLTNAAVNLTGATAVFYMKHQRAKAAKVSAAAAVITDATNGLVEYRWASTDLDVPGIYDAEFRITHSDGKFQRVRIEGVEVLAKLA